MPTETIFSISPSPVKFGPGALEELGRDARRLGMARIALFTDPWVAKLECMETTRKALLAEGLDLVVYDECRIEPTDKSFLEAARFASSRPASPHRD